LNPDVALHLARLFTSADVHLIDNASHWPQWDRPDTVAALIKGAAGKPRLSSAIGGRHAALQ